MIQALTHDWKDDTLGVAATAAMLLAGADEAEVDESLDELVEEKLDDRGKKLVRRTYLHITGDKVEKALEHMDSDTRRVFHAAYDAYWAEQADLMHLIVDSCARTRDTILTRKRCAEIRERSVYVLNSRVFAEIDRRVRMAESVCSAIEMQKCDQCSFNMIRSWHFSRYRGSLIFLLVVYILFSLALEARRYWDQFFDGVVA